jgi:hypothetical protein
MLNRTCCRTIRAISHTLSCSGSVPRRSITRSMVKGSERRVARLTLRLPPSLRDAIGRCAEKDRRSVSDWIVMKLEDAVATCEGKSGKP